MVCATCWTRGTSRCHERSATQGGRPVSQVCMTPITNAKAWRGETLARETARLVARPDAEIADIDRAVTTAKASGLPLERIQREHFPLTVMRKRLQQSVADTDEGRGSGAPG